MSKTQRGSIEKETLFKIGASVDKTRHQHGRSENVCECNTVVLTHDKLVIR
jgi:hypothetical protein